VRFAPESLCELDRIHCAICSGFIVRFTPDFATRMVRKIHGDVLPKMLQYRKCLQNSSPVEKIEKIFLLT